MKLTFHYDQVSNYNSSRHIYCISCRKVLTSTHHHLLNMNTKHKHLSLLKYCLYRTQPWPLNCTCIIICNYWSP